MELKYETQDSAGRKATLIGEAGKGVANGTFEFQGGPVGIKVETDAKSSDLYGSIAVALTSEKRSGFAVIGAEGQYNMTNKELMKKNFVMSYCDGKQSEVSLHVLDKMSAGMLSYSHHVRPGFSVGGQMTHTLGSSDTVLAFGSAYRLDGVTTVKAKVNSTGNLALSYIQDVRPNTTLIMSSKFDVNKLDSAKVGISLTVE